MWLSCGLPGGGRLVLARRHVADGRVEAHTVVERLDVLEDRRPGLLPGPEERPIGELGLQRLEERLGAGVVVAVALAAHALANAAELQQPAERSAGVLHAAIGVEQQALRWPVGIAARAAIARGTSTRYSQSVRVNSDGSKSVETTEEEPGFKERLDALEQLDRITGYA